MDGQLNCFATPKSPIYSGRLLAVVLALKSRWLLGNTIWQPLCQSQTTTRHKGCEHFFSACSRVCWI